LTEALFDPKQLVNPTGAFSLPRHVRAPESKVPRCEACGRPVPARNRARVGGLVLGNLCKRCLVLERKGGRVVAAGSRLGLNIRLGGGQKIEEWVVPLHVWFQEPRRAGRTVLAPSPHGSRLSRVLELRARGVASA
jgi:hypothetical protein